MNFLYSSARIYEDMIKLAILDMYNGETNLGLKSITDLLDQRFASIRYEVFDVRLALELPDLSFDVYVSTGGPGHPLDGEEKWGGAYYELVDSLIAHNQRSHQKKHVFFICHSFQIVCNYLNVGKIVRRPRESFGLFPVRKTAEGDADHIFKYLPNTFCAADFRKFQVIRPDFRRIEELDAEILAIEHESRLPHSDPALMAFKLGDEMYGTQFHPEAYPEGMLSHFSDPSRREQIITDRGATVYEAMLIQLRDPLKLSLTYEMVLPQFLKSAIKALSSALVPVE